MNLVASIEEINKKIKSLNISNSAAIVFHHINNLKKVKIVLIYLNFDVKKHNMSFLKEFLEFLKIRKKYWLLPIIIVLVILGGLIILSQGSVVAPFIYTIF